MTLSTDFIIRERTGARAVFDFCQDLLTETDDPLHRPRKQQRWTTNEPDKWRRNPRWGNSLGQGLPAILTVEHGPDGPLLRGDCFCDETHGDGADDPCGYCWEPEGFIKVNWDTAYGYSGPHGAGCATLHAYYILRLGAWCDERGLPWSWRNEFTGEWHDGRDGLEEFAGANQQEALAWFQGSVAPALSALAKR